MSDQIGAASIGLGIDASGVDAGLDRMEASVTRAERSITTLGRRGSAAVDSIGDTASTSAGSVDRATRSIQNSIQRTIAVTEAGERGTKSYFEALANQRGANVDALRPFLNQLEEVTKKQREAAEEALRSGSAYNQTSQSIAALNANLRGVPAQLTDIITGLQGGQNPLTVLIQQGGQLTDMFGSMEEAARALGGYLRTFITPLTVAAAAVAVLAVAYNQGSKESDAFRRSIVLSGNAAGVTTGQLDTMARKASETSGTIGKNAEVLAQLVRTGQVGAENLVRYTSTAVQSQKFLGIAVEETVSAFADLGKSPVEAVLKLNEEYNFLTLATYKQIQALEDQNRTAEAGKVAQKAFADAMDQNSKTVQASLGYLERAWNATGSAAKSAWDFMLDVGRENTLDDKIKAAEKALKAADLARYSFTGGTAAEKTAAKEEAQRQLDRLQNQKKVAELTATSTAEEQKRIDAGIKFEQQADQFLSRREQREKEITAAINLGRQAAPRGEDPAITEKNIQDRIALIRNNYADLDNASIEAQIGNVKRLGEAREEAAKRALIPDQARDEAGLNKAFDTRIGYIEKMGKAEDAALLRQKANLQQQLAILAQLAGGEDDQAAKQQRMSELRGEIARKDAQLLTNRAELQKQVFALEVQDTRRIFEAEDARLEARQSDVAALQKQVQAQKDQNAALGLTVAQSQALTTSFVEERAVRLELEADIVHSIAGREAEAEAMRNSARLMRELNKEQIAGANKSAAINANKKFWESVDNTAQAAFTNIFEGGKSAFDRLKDALKSGLLDMLYQLTVKKWIISLSTSTEGASIQSQLAGILGGGSSSGSGGSSLFGSATNLFSIGKTIYQGFSTGIAASMGTQIASLGNLFGSQAVSAFGTGMTLTTSQAATAASAYGAAGNSAAAGGLTAGAGAASAIPIIGWIIAGMAANDGFYKQGYRIDGQRGDITKELLESTLKGNIFGPVGAAATVGIGIGDSLLRKLGLDSRTASLLSGSSLWTKAFGLGAPRVENQGIQGTINAQGVDAENFATVLQKGGWFRSDKRTGVTSALDTDADASFDKTVQAMVSAVRGFGMAIGEQTTQIDSYTKQFKLTLTGDAEKDKALLNTLFSDVGNELSTLLVPSLAKLTQEGESAAAALQRIAGDYVAIDAALGAIGLKFGAVGAGSLEARESLVSLSGGIQNFVSNAEFFSQNFLSESERIDAVSKQLNKSFADLGVTSIPKTRDEFESLVKGLDLTTVKGRETFAGLMGLQQAFAAITPQIDEMKVAAEAAAKALAVQKEQRALDIQLMEAMGDAEGALAATRADALASLLTDQARATQAQIYAAQDAKKIYDSLVGVADDALSRLTASINAEKDGINAAAAAQADAIRLSTSEAVKLAQKSLQAAQTQVSAIKAVFGALDGALDSTKIESASASLARRQAAQAVLTGAAAKPGNLADNKSITDALSTITGQSNERFFGTFEEYARDQARTNNAIAALRDQAVDQVDNAELTVEKLQEAIEAIQKSGEEHLKQLQKDTDAQIAALDASLVKDTEQLDALKGIDSRVLSLTEATLLFASAIGALKANPTGAATSNRTAIENLYASVLGRQADAAGLKFYENALASGVTLEQIRKDFLASQEYKDLIAKGGVKNAIIPPTGADQVAALMARAADPAQNSATLLKEIQRLNQLTENQQATLDAIAAATGITGDVLEKAQKGGQPIGMKAV